MSSEQFSSFEEWGHAATRFSQWGMFLRHQNQLTIDNVSRGIEFIFQGQVKLVLPGDKVVANSWEKMTELVQAPVELGQDIYGNLIMSGDLGVPNNIQIVFLALLAPLCAWMLMQVHTSLQEEAQARSQKTQGEVQELTKRQKQVLELMCMHYDEKAIAKLLRISPATVEKHRMNIYNKLGVRRERDAQRVARQLGLFP